MRRGGASATRWTRILRRLVRDAVSWSDAVANRMGTTDPALREQLTLEALGLAGCLLGERLRRAGADSPCAQSVAAQLQREWASLLARHGLPTAALPNATLLAEPAAATCPTGPEASLAGGGGGSGVDQQQAALEFQRATGLGPSALVNDGHNLAALIFYHRVYLAARRHPAFTAAHRAQIVKAAQQCRERFARVLRGAPADHPAPQPILNPAAVLLLVER